MHNICGKVFQNIQTKDIECLLYDPQQNYYDVVQNASKSGYQQSIFTSSVMIALIEEFLLKHDSIVTEIEFSVEDEEVNQEIKKIIEQMEDNGAYWGILKDKLSVLSEYDSIDIEKVRIKSKQENGFFLSLQANGIFDVTEDAYDLVATEICNVVKRVIREDAKEVRPYDSLWDMYYDEFEDLEEVK